MRLAKGQEKQEWGQGWVLAPSPVGGRGARGAQARAIAIAMALGGVNAIVKLLQRGWWLMLVACSRLGAWPRPDGAEEKDAVGE